jgi:hypothetical protein
VAPGASHTRCRIKQHTRAPACLTECRRAHTHKHAQDQDGKELGVAGSMQRLAANTLSSQPISAFSWSPDKQGLFVCCSLDQCLRVGFVTKLNKV